MTSVVFRSVLAAHFVIQDQALIKAMSNAAWQLQTVVNEIKEYEILSTVLRKGQLTVADE